MYTYNFSFNEYISSLKTAGINGIGIIIDYAVQDEKLTANQFKKISTFAAKREADLMRGKCYAKENK